MQNEPEGVVDLTSTEPSEDVTAAPSGETPAVVQAEAQVALTSLRAEELSGSAVHPAPSNTHEYPSLYDTKATSVLAIVMGILIVAGVQLGVARIFATSKTEHHALTHFVTAMVGLVLGVYVCDMLIAGPTTELLAEQERITILAFIKDTCLMVFAYYFGTRAIPPSDNNEPTNIAAKSDKQDEQDNG